MSVDIRNGWLRRDEAAAIMRAREGVFPGAYMGVSLEDILAGIDMGRETFDTLVRQFTNESIFGVPKAVAC